jgi:hypothetical protein
MQNDLKESQKENVKLRDDMNQSRRVDKENLRANSQSNPEAAALEKSIKDFKLKVSSTEQELR